MVTFVTQVPPQRLPLFVELPRVVGMLPEPVPHRCMALGACTVYKQHVTHGKSEPLVTIMHLHRYHRHPCPVFLARQLEVVHPSTSTAVWAAACRKTWSMAWR